MAELPKIVRAQLARKAEREAVSGAPDMPQSGFHPDANLLAAFAERTLAPREREQVLGHLADCAPCRELVALAFPAPEVQSDLAAAEASRGHGSRLPSWLGWRAVRWGVLTASVGIIMAGAFREGVLHAPRSARNARPTVAELEPSSPVMVPSPAPAGRARSALANAPTPGSRAAANKQLAFDKKADAQSVQQLRTQLAGRSKENLNAIAEAARFQSSRADTSGGLQSAQQATAGAAQAAVGRDVEAQAAPALPPPRTPAAPPVSAAARFAAAEPSPAKASMKAPRAKDAPALMEKKVAPLRQEAATEAIEVRPSASAQTQSGAPAPTAERQSNEVVRQKAGAAGSPATAGGQAVSGALMSRSSQVPAATNEVIAPQLGRARAKTSRAAYWTISAAGKIERSRSATRPWREVSVTVDDSVTFRAVTADGANVWAGGSGGALYHSTDGGESWTRVRVGPNQNAGQAVVTSAIVSVKFSDAQHGVIATAAGETWTTADGGAHWSRQ